jgi:hypothetical protein
VVAQFSALHGLCFVLSALYGVLLGVFPVAASAKSHLAVPATQLAVTIMGSARCLERCCAHRDGTIEAAAEYGDDVE